MPQDKIPFDEIAKSKIFGRASVVFLLSYLLAF